MNTPEPLGSLPISETFLSLQGEGKLTGIPSFFIRTSGCNLRCWWCDTPYASWKPEGAMRRIDSLIDEAAASGARHAVLTGGEPMMFAPLAALASGLRQRGFHMTIETAGTIFREVTCDLMSISPKLSNSTPTPQRPFPAGHPAATMSTAALQQWEERHEERRLNIPALQQLIDRSAERQLKFVVAAPEDLPEIDTLLAQLTGWQPSDVLLMPEGVTPPTPAARQWIAHTCVQRGFRYCPRLHIELYGNTRGT